MAASNSDDDGQGGTSTRGGVGAWVLMRLNRWVLTGLVLLAVFLALIGVSYLGLTPFRQLAQRHAGVQYLFSAFIGAIITGTSIVVTINQLVLSQELGAIGDQRDRMRASIEFQQDVEGVIGEAQTPPEPSAFLWELLDGTHELAEDLIETVDADHADDEDLRSAVESYAENVIASADTVKSDIEGAQFGTFDVIWAALRYDYSRKIYDGRALRTEFDETLSDAAEEDLDDLLQSLQLFGPAREHFKTLYFQWELINLSRALLYVAIPALAVMGALIMFADETTLPGAFLGIDHLVWVASAGFTVGIAPFVVFTSFILRIATVAKRTLAMGPFILQSSGHDPDLD